MHTHSYKHRCIHRCCAKQNTYLEVILCARLQCFLLSESPSSSPPDPEKNTDGKRATKSYTALALCMDGFNGAGHYPACT